MSISYAAIKTNCVIWRNIALPHPDKNLKSPPFCLDEATWYFEVSCMYTKYTTTTTTTTPASTSTPLFGCVNTQNVFGCANTQNTIREVSVEKSEEMFKFTMKCSDDSRSSNYIVIPYVESEGKFVRIAPTIEEREIYRSTLSTIIGSDRDTITMLFSLTQHSLSTEQNFREKPLVMMEENDDSEGKELLKLVNLESASRDFEQLFDDEKYSDAIVKNGDNGFFVHKNILSARSEVFRAMFEHDLLENTSGIITIEDMDPTILKQFLQCLYSGKLETTTIETAIDLYIAADKYAVESLKKLCSTYMLSNVSKESVCKILLVADKIGDTELFNGVATFAANDDELLKTQEWMDFALQYSSVAIKVCLKYISRNNLF